MSLIKKPQELDVPQKIKALIYGQAGMGKTTLALSAPHPLLLDFDGGAQRVNYLHLCPTVPIKTWNDAEMVLRENLSEYETIVVDTIGKMFEYIIVSVCGTRVPQIRDWNAINANFKAFTRAISTMNKNVIYVAHRDVRKEGDDTVFVPALREKSYTAIVSELDLLGYVEMKGDVRTITFNPTSRNDGKNTCNLPAIMNIPTVVDVQGTALDNVFFKAQVIAPYVANMQQRREAAEEYKEVVELIKENILVITDDLSANDFVSRIDEFKHVGNSKVVASKLMTEKARELNLVFDKTIKKYFKKENVETT